MPILLQLVLCSLVGGAFSLIGGVLLAYHKRSNSLAGYATSFAAGALLAAAFVDLLPEALEGAEPLVPMACTMLGLILFFLLEAGVNWFHSHSHSESEDTPRCEHEHHAECPDSHEDNRSEPIIAMVVLGGALHHAIDGVAIAAGFLVSPVSGLIVTMAIAAHEIPHRIGDFGIMLHHGWNRTKTLAVSLVISLATTASAVVFYLLGDAVEIPMAPLLGVVAGFFIYIAVADILPAIHREKDRRKVFFKSLWLIVGIVVVSSAILALHGLVSTIGIH